MQTKFGVSVGIYFEMRVIDLVNEINTCLSVVVLFQVLVFFCFVIADVASEKFIFMVSGNMVVPR